jgi:hypothetical protein
MTLVVETQDKCPDCGEPILMARVANRPGPEWYDAFTPEPTIGGPWRLIDGAMVRRGAGPRPGYHLHVRRCPKADLTAMIERVEWTPLRSYQTSEEQDDDVES